MCSEVRYTMDAKAFHIRDETRFIDFYLPSERQREY
jgi:hypothetical protein